MKSLDKLRGDIYDALNPIINSIQDEGLYYTVTEDKWIQSFMVRSRETEDLLIEATISSRGVQWFFHIFNDTPAQQSFLCSVTVMLITQYFDRAGLLGSAAVENRKG